MKKPTSAQRTTGSYGRKGSQRQRTGIASTKTAAQFTLGVSRKHFKKEYSYHYFNEINMQKSIKVFIEMLEDSFREQAAALKQAAEEIQRFIVCVEAQDRTYLPYPPYRERMKPKQYSKRIYWHRIRSNPQRRRKPY